MKVLSPFFLTFSLIFLLYVSPCFPAAEAPKDATEFEKIVSDEKFGYDSEESDDDGDPIKRVSNRCTVTIRMSNLATKGTASVSSDVFAEVLKADTAITVLALVRGTSDTGTFGVPQEYTPSNRPPKGGATAHMATDHPDNKSNAIKFKTAYSGWKQHAVQWVENSPIPERNRTRSLQYYGYGAAEKQKTSPSSQGADWVKKELSPIGYAESKAGGNQGGWFPEIYISGDASGIKAKENKE